MTTYPTGAHAVVELHQRDLLAQAEREQMVMIALAQTPRTTTVATLRSLVASSGRMVWPIFRWWQDMARSHEVPQVADTGMSSRLTT